MEKQSQIQCHHSLVSCVGLYSTCMNLATLYTFTIFIKCSIYNYNINDLFNIHPIKEWAMWLFCLQNDWLCLVFCIKVTFVLVFTKNLQNLKRKKERNLKRCALFAFVLGWVEFYMDGWLALRVSHTPSSIPFTSDGSDEEFDQKWKEWRSKEGSQERQAWERGRDVLGEGGCGKHIA